jgi:hypothetical protein
MQQVNTDGSHLAASSDRVGWLTSAGEYIEYSPQGVELDRFDGLPGVENEGLRITGLALSPKNALVVGLHGGQPQKNLSQVWALDRRAGTWQPALPETTDWASVAGFDGERLVVLPSLGEAGNMRWYSSKRAEVGQ